MWERRKERKHVRECGRESVRLGKKVRKYLVENERETEKEKKKRARKRE